VILAPGERIEIGTSERWGGVVSMAAHRGIAPKSVYRRYNKKVLATNQMGQLSCFNLSKIVELMSMDSELEKPIWYVQSRFSTKTQTYRLTPKTRSR